MSTTVAALLTTTFEDHPLDVVAINDAPCYIAAQVGRALGYSDEGKRLSRQVGQDWTASNELTEGRDYHRLKGDVLRAFKQVGTSGVSTYARQLIVLTERGLHMVLLLSDQDAGRRLRAHLADQVLPRLARGEAPESSTALAPASAAPPLTLEQRTLQLNEQREARLRAQHEARLARQPALDKFRERQQRVNQSDRYEAMLKDAVSRGALSQAQVDADLPRRLQMLTGGERPALALLTPGHKSVSVWLSATQMAKRMDLDRPKTKGCTWVGTAANALGLKTDATKARKVGGWRTSGLNGEPQLNTDGSQKTCQQFEYHPSATGELRDWLRERFGVDGHVWASANTDKQKDS